jgi:nucleotide-binding universal stress UspA family protein
VGEDVAGNIMLTIRKEQVDLLIISSHGKSGWRETVFGSIADCVVKQVECPMLLLRSAKPGVKTDQDHDNANGALLVGSSR